MHASQKEFCLRVKQRFPAAFVGKRVLDCGSLDINGNNRYLFTDCEYTGIDIGPGKNVDVVTRIHEYLPDNVRVFDTIISTECFEHDEYWTDSLINIRRLLRTGGLFLFTCAGEGRKEHGTAGSSPVDSPWTHGYYRNLTVDLMESLPLTEWFLKCVYEVDNTHCDLYFWGVKK